MTEPGPPPRLRLVLPGYNEAARLVPAAFLDFLGSRGDTALLFVDDGSTDGTARILADIAVRSEGRCSVLALPQNFGKAVAVHRGLAAVLESRPELIGYWDSDLSTPLDAVQDFLDVLDADPRVEMVIGSRVKLLGRAIRRREARHYVGRVFATAASMALGMPVYDTQCGAKVFRATEPVVRALELPFQSSWVFDVELLARYIRIVGREAALERIYELPLKKWVDVPGSKVRPWHAFKAALDLLRIGLRARP